MKTLTLTAGLFLAVLSGAAPPANPLPGGVAAPILWSGRDTTDRVNLLPDQPLTIFAVYLPDDTERVVWSIAQGDSSQQVLTDRRLVDLNEYRYLNFGEEANCGGPVLRTYVGTPASGSAIGGRRSAGAKLFVGSHLAVPELPVANRSDGVLELIAYDRILSPRERQRVESYLALRHGLTLDQEEARHYLSPTGRVIWDGHRNRTHRHRIFGLLTDRNGEETRGESTNCGGGVLSVSAGPAESPFGILISDDDGPTILAGDRLERSWVMQTHGTPPSRLSLHLRPRHLYETLPPGNEWEVWVDTSGTANFANPLRIAARDGRFDLPVHRRRQHFTLAPSRPVVNEDPAAGIDHLSLSPNPSPDGRYRLRLVLHEPEAVTVDAYTNLGQRIATLSSPRGRYHELSDLLPTAGPYHLRVRAGTIVTTTQLTVQ
jgi:hypothetical protein